MPFQLGMELYITNLKLILDFEIVKNVFFLDLKRQYKEILFAESKAASGQKSEL